MRRLTSAVILLALALVSGCGFHLRGQTPLPAVMTRPYIDTTDQYSALYSALQAQLRAAGATPAGSAAEASGTIRLHVDKTGREVLSVTADNKPGEYEVYYATEYSVTSGTTELLALQKVRLTRDYGYDETAVLAKEHEERSLRAALAEEIAALILRRLAAL